MSSNLPLVRRSRRVLPWSGGLINEGGIILSDYGILFKIQGFSCRGL